MTLITFDIIYFQFCWILIKIIWFSAAIKCCKMRNNVFCYSLYQISLHSLLKIQFISWFLFQCCALLWSLCWLCTSPVTCVMALVLRNFANSNIAMQMPRRTATVLLRVVPPWVHQNPQHFPAAIASLASNGLSFVMIVKQSLAKLLRSLIQIQVVT